MPQLQSHGLVLWGRRVRLEMVLDEGGCMEIRAVDARPTSPEAGQDKARDSC
jgi:hypothetical protein